MNGSKGALRDRLTPLEIFGLSLGGDVVIVPPSFDSRDGFDGLEGGMNKSTNDLLRGKLEELSEAMKPTQAMKDAFANLSAKSISERMFSAPQIERSFDFTQLKIPSQEEVNGYQSASVLMQSLADEALRWQKSVPDGYAPAIIAILYGGIQIEVHTLEKVSFHGIRIGGVMDNFPCAILAHQSTVQMLCCAQKINPDIPKRPIGFMWDGQNVEV